MIKMATYPGMSLRGEVRESVSLDEDDLSDVEDEVFIRDGKNGYKLAEEMNVKRPLMAPRRKSGRPDVAIRLKQKPPCRAMCKPCCYIFAALSVLIGLIVLVVIIVSIYPLPMDRLREWIIQKSKNYQPPIKLLPCENLKVTEVWSVNLPKLTSDCPVRTADVNGDGVEDILFGFGTGDNYNSLPPDLFCPIFMGVSPPCQGGIIALNGVNGEIIWRHWLNDSIFNLHCTADINGDRTNDCLAVGIDGTITTINTKNGSTIWQLNTGKLNVFVANFIPDQNNDSIPDIIASHSFIQDKKGGHIILFSGKNGSEIKRINIPNEAKTFYMPEILKINQNNSFIIFGSGSPHTAGNLSAVPLKEFIEGNLTNLNVLYQDIYKGILTQSVLVDITGDNIPDIVTAMYNSTVVAIDGSNFTQIWNFTIEGSAAETTDLPTPGYFNFDNITDFLVIYQKYDNILNYNYTQTFILDGKTGKSIYPPTNDGVISQMQGLTLSMETYGYDMFLYWTSECANSELTKTKNIQTAESTSLDICRNQYNTSTIFKLNALSQFHQPPGFVVFDSALHQEKEYNNTKSILSQVKEYLKNHQKIPLTQGQTEVDESYNVDPGPIGIRKYGKSSFRHKDGRHGNLKEYTDSTEKIIDNTSANDDSLENEQERFALSENDYPSLLSEGLVPDIENYPVVDADGTIPYNQKKLIFGELTQKSNLRDPRSKDKKINTSKIPDSGEEIPKQSKSKKKNLSDKIFGYKNVRMSKNQLFQDVNRLPTDILRDTYFKNEERRLKKSKFEQRDIRSHEDRKKDNEEIKKLIEEEKQLPLNGSLTLWDLESEKEIQDRENGIYSRVKRKTDYNFDSIAKVTSVGAVLNSINTTNFTNSIDVVFVKYWEPIEKPEATMLKEYLEECIQDKMEHISKDETHAYQKTTDSEQRILYQKECLEEQKSLKKDFSFFKQLRQLKLGQMTVYRLRIECKCDSVKMAKNERCVRFLPKDYQSWSSYLGNYGDGVYQRRG